MQKENSAIAKQLISVGKEMNEVRMKYRSMFKESKDSPDITEAGTPELPALQCVMYVQICSLLNYQHLTMRIRNEEGTIDCRMLSWILLLCIQT